MYIGAIFAYFVSYKYINVCTCNSLLVILRSKGRIYIYPLIDIIEWYRKREKERMSTLNSVEYRMYETVLPRESESEGEGEGEGEGERERKVSIIFPKRFLFVILSLGIA